MRLRPIPVVCIAAGLGLGGYSTVHVSRHLPEIHRQFEAKEITKDNWAMDQLFLSIESWVMAGVAFLLVVFGVRVLWKGAR